jgi:hypothetical protein
MLKQDNLTLSLFTYYSPSDQDGYLRPSLDYRLDDNLTLSAGANLFSGKEQHTFFGQLRENDNAWLRATYSF